MVHSSMPRTSWCGRRDGLLGPYVSRGRGGALSGPAQDPDGMFAQFRRLLLRHRARHQPGEKADTAKSSQYATIRRWTGRSSRLIRAPAPLLAAAFQTTATWGWDSRRLAQRRVMQVRSASIRRRSCRSGGGDQGRRHRVPRSGRGPAQPVDALSVEGSPLIIGPNSVSRTRQSERRAAVPISRSRPSASRLTTSISATRWRSADQGRNGSQGALGGRDAEGRVGVEGEPRRLKRAARIFKV